VKAFLSHIKRPGSRGASILAAVVIAILFLDAGLVLVRTTAASTASHPQPQLPRASEAPAQTAPRREVAAVPGQVLDRLVAELLPAKVAAADQRASQPAVADPVKVQATTDKAGAAEKGSSAAAPAFQAAAPLAQANEIGLAGGPVAASCEAGSGQVVTETVNSKVLGTNLPVHVYLPPCYDPVHYTYPALYLIRGTDGYGNWVKNGLPQVADAQIGAGALPPFIAVMPATDEWARGGGKYRYSSGGKGSWEEFMLDDLLPFVEGKYSVWRDRDGRAIGGISRGAYWSLEIAFRHPDLFGIVAGHSPAITPDILIGVPGNFSMLDLAESADDVRSLRIYLDAGDNDWARRGVKRLSTDLDADGIPYTATSGEGIHSDPYWASRMSDYLSFYAATWPSIARAKPSAVGFTGNAAPGQP